MEVYPTVEKDRVRRAKTIFKLLGEVQRCPNSGTESPVSDAQESTARRLRGGPKSQEYTGALIKRWAVREWREGHPTGFGIVRQD